MLVDGYTGDTDILDWPQVYDSIYTGRYIGIMTKRWPKIHATLATGVYSTHLLLLG